LQEKFIVRKSTRPTPCVIFVVQSSSFVFSSSGPQSAAISNATYLAFLYLMSPRLIRTELHAEQECLDVFASERHLEKDGDSGTTRAKTQGKNDRRI
jgi:hypothetical protein